MHIDVPINESIANSAKPAKPPRGATNRNPPELSLWALIAEDLRTHDGNPFEQGFWAIALHRFGNWRMSLRLKLLRAPCTLIYLIMFKAVECVGGISLPYTVELGRRVRIWHHSGMILHAESIGNDVQIRHNTTFGVARTGQNHRIPIIEDRVDIGCGACILGPVRIGHDARIGANAVVLHDVPAFGVAVGVPARVVKVYEAETRQVIK